MRAIQILIIAFKASLLACGIANGEVVRVNIDCQGQQSSASGVTIGSWKATGEAAILTAAHCVRSDAVYWVAWHDGKWIQAKCIGSKLTSDTDIAVLSCPITGEWTAPKMSKYDIANPQRVNADVCGFQYGSYKRRSGVAVEGHPFAPGLAVEPGDSGGAVVRTDDKTLLGIVSAKMLAVDGVAVRQPEMIYTPSHVIVDWLNEQRYEIDGRYTKLETQCINGRCYTRPYYVVPQPPALVPQPPLIVEPPVVVPGSVRKAYPVPGPPREDAPGCKCKPGTGCNCKPTVGCNCKVPPQGPKGDKGDPGEVCTCKSVDGDIAELKAEIKRLKETPTKVQIRENGKLVDEDVYPHGAPIVLDLTPVE